MFCGHMRNAREVLPSGTGCKECLGSGDRWVHLRLCLSCGHVGCCDSSPGRHATKHFRSTSHPVVRSFEPRERWIWCYVDANYDEPEETVASAIMSARARPR
jgi:uncharacterized UBP type Zn finger protein